MTLGFDRATSLALTDAGYMPLVDYLAMFAPAIRQRDQQQASDHCVEGRGVDQFHNGSNRTEAERNHG